MGQGIFERIQSKIDIWRLEQRYTRRRNRRSTFVSNAIYVDGEYIYQTPNATGSSNNSNSSSAYESSASPSPTHAQTFSPETTSAQATKERKKLNRFSSMPGFGSMGKRDIAPPPADWRTQRASYDGAR
ncbi:hypothetical protein F5883DRAFT_235748 [Diaporthe sp. PMI_573]|nr:hypothetical protein F5883DRAFT_235748 [Diaporthaceae sp. PMI_573]